MNLLIDQNLSPRLVQLLAAKGISAQHVAHVGLSGASDPEVWRYAYNHDQAVVTINAADFLHLAADVELQVLTWSDDDSEIVFSVAPPSPATTALKAIRLADGTERTLDAGKGYFAVRSAPSELYYSAKVSDGGDSDLRLFRTPRTVK